ncbi:TonB-dependent receptor plug domain-containing protein, partial [Acinetobacter baumannii]
RSPSGEGSKVTVRGVGPDFNLILLNGRQMPTGIISNENGGANGSRAFDFANLSSDSIAALEVFKTSRAASPTGGIGATINVKTARPLD